jgi:hypothetical protein
VLLRDLQKLLTTVYGTGIRADVLDYLVTDAGWARAVEKPAEARDIEEKLLLHESNGELGVALYLDATLLERLSAADPRVRLCGRNLADFCTVIEGISHLNYVAWCAARDQTVTLLELEMQAEIDKYIGARALLENQDDSDLGGRLLAELFDEPLFDDALSAEELERYRNACGFANRYCRSLESRFPTARFAPRMVRELRAFYRLPQPGKISHIHSAVFS